MKKRWLAGLMTHQYKKLPVTLKIWMQFNVMPRTYKVTRQSKLMFMRPGTQDWAADKLILQATLRLVTSVSQVNKMHCSWKNNTLSSTNLWLPPNRPSTRPAFTSCELKTQHTTHNTSMNISNLLPVEGGRTVTKKENQSWLWIRKFFIAKQKLLIVLQNKRAQKTHMCLVWNILHYWLIWLATKHIQNFW